MGTSERKEREKVKVRRLILEAAMRLFLNEGYERVTMRKIAQEIEYSPGTLYHYFKDKDAILYALHEEAFERLIGRQEGILSEKDPLLRLKKHAEVYIGFAFEFPEFYDLMFIMRGPARVEWSAGLRSYELLSQNIRDCIAAGYFRGENPETVSFALWSLVHGMVSLVIRKRCIMIPEGEIRNVMEAALSFIMANAK